MAGLSGVSDSVSERATFQIRRYCSARQQKPPDGIHHVMTLSVEPPTLPLHLIPPTPPSSQMDSSSPAGIGVPIATSQILSTVVHLLGVSIISFCFGRRTVTVGESLSTFKGWFSISVARLAVLLVFIDSWLFLFSSGVLANGIGLVVSSTPCSAAILLCIIFYVTSKVFIYIFLAERVYIVWTAATSIRRRTCKVYCVCVALIFVYALIIGSMFFGRIAIYNPDRTCAIGLKRFASIPLLTYDLVLNVFMTSLFIIPIWRDAFANRGLKQIAVRTLISAAIALTTSTVNILILALFGGHEAAWLCLAACSTDVAINALALFWVTSSSTFSNNNNKDNNKTFQGFGQGRISFTPVHIPISFADPDPSLSLNDWPWDEEAGVTPGMAANDGTRRPSASKEWSSVAFGRYRETATGTAMASPLPSPLAEDSGFIETDSKADPDAVIVEKPPPFSSCLPNGEKTSIDEQLSEENVVVVSPPLQSWSFKPPSPRSPHMPIQVPSPIKIRHHTQQREGCLPTPLPSPLSVQEEVVEDEEVEPPSSLSSPSSLRENVPPLSNTSPLPSLQPPNTQSRKSFEENQKPP